MGHRKREWWERAVSEWRTSGMSAAIFASQLGVHASTLRWWGWRFRSEARQAAPAGAAGAFVELVAVTPTPGSAAIDSVATDSVATDSVSAGVAVQVGDVVVRSMQWPAPDWVAAVALHVARAR